MKRTALHVSFRPFHVSLHLSWLCECRCAFDREKMLKVARKKKKRKEKKEREKARKLNCKDSSSCFSASSYYKLRAPETLPRSQGNKIQDTVDL